MRDEQTVVYVAGPFRAETSWQVEQNIRRAEALALELWKMGYAVVCPHLNTRHFQGELPDSAWLKGDLAILQKCDLVVVTPDWDRSAGAREEVAAALRAGIPVRKLAGGILVPHGGL